MRNSSNVFNYLAAGADVVRLGVETHNVIWLRVMGLAGVWNTPFDEGWRMVAEKPKAFIHSGRDGMLAALAGHPPDRVVTASLRPLTETTKSNRQRLAGRGMRKH